MPAPLRGALGGSVMAQEPQALNLQPFFKPQGVGPVIAFSIRGYTYIFI